MSDSSHNQDVRWKQRFYNFKRAFVRLAGAAALAKQRPLSELEEQGLVQAFEFTHELAWNTLKDYLEAQGFTNIVGSKGATREAFKNGLIENGETWMEMIKHRNETSHTYNEAVAAAIVEAIRMRYVGEFETFERRFARLEKEAP